jgi:uncharacterized membrane protein
MNSRDPLGGAGRGRENVRPLRPTPPQKKGFDARDPENLAKINYGLAMAAFAITWAFGSPLDLIGLGIGVAAVAIAASKREEGVSWLRSHHEFVLRTVIIGGVAWTLLSLVGWIFGALPLIGGMIKFVAYVVGQPLIVLWVVVRSVVGFARLQGRKPNPNPVSLLL